ncbi:MAG: hypothetical protein ACI935_003155 [Moritella dasanensis]|jgi:hypothetical protein
MLFMVGIETPENEQCAYGMVVPAFDILGYGCVSAADEEADVLSQVKLAILDMAEEAYKDGHLLSSLDVGYKDHSEEYPDFDRWIELDVPVETIQAQFRLSKNRLRQIAVLNEKNLLFANDDGLNEFIE